MRIFIIIVLIAGTAQCAVPAYGLQPSEENYSETSVREEADRIAQEKESIMESVAPLREERERNLHPFVQPAVVNQDISAGGGRDRPLQDFKLRPFSANETPVVKYPNNIPEPKRGINFALISIIMLAFLASYFFIRPKSK